jgi:high-affinity nickel permease
MDSRFRLSVKNLELIMGLEGTSVSGSFLLLVGIVNTAVVVQLLRNRRKVWDHILRDLHDIDLSVQCRLIGQRIQKTRSNILRRLEDVWPGSLVQSSTLWIDRTRCMWSESFLVSFVCKSVIYAP